ncbi:acid protease [Cubamyces sp. BRFM 1775]|nr:acid protease [Cubamyces sp. BRFM 1775]
MTRWSTALLLLAATLMQDFGAEAITVPIEGYRRSGKWWKSLGGVQTRQDEIRNMVGIVDLQNAGDLQYYMNVTLGGKEFRLLVDSGSADLWVAGDVPQSKDTGNNAVIHYNDGTIQGPVKTAALDIEGYTIPDQAYIAENVDPMHPDGQGILGLGPSRLSSILASMGGAAGDPPLDRLFRQTTSLPTYISILLGRSNDPDSTIPGQLTIGEVLSNYSDVTKSPQLPIQRIDWDQHWMVALDKGGIIGPDGQPIQASVDSELKVIFDSGYTLPQVPKSVADAIYSRVPGAKFVNISATATPVWTLPCTVELNVTFKFGGISYPVHPLDTVMDDLQGPLDDNGHPSCVGAFQPMAAEEPYDIVLGMAFLRNAYILMSFGDFVDGSQAKAGDPFIQLHSITNLPEAHQDFVQQRLGGVDTTGFQHLLPSSDEDNTQVTLTTRQRVREYLPWIVCASILGGLLLAFGVAYFFIWRSGRRYRRLHEPAPSGLDDGNHPPLHPPKSSEATQLLPSSDEKPEAWTDLEKAVALPNPYEYKFDATSEALARKVTAGDLMPNRRPYKTRNVRETRESSSASSTERLLPTPPGIPRSYEASGKAKPLVSDDRPLPNPYASRSSGSASVDAPLRTTSPEPISPDSGSRPLPDPYEYGTPRVAEVFDISRSRMASVYTLPPLAFSSATLSLPDGSNAGSQTRSQAGHGSSAH